MSHQAPASTAQILDFAEYRRRRSARAVATPVAKRRFVWSWPATGHVTLVDFLAPAAASAAARMRLS
jgi:hypothetical protein